MHANRTWNQHYIAQVEQRLNAINPQDPKRRQRIHLFDVSDREPQALTPRDARGGRIRTSLSCTDLFSFDVVDLRYRNNLEALFQQYETDILSDSQSLLGKLQANRSDIKKELVDLFAAKFLNFVRNPYSVQKALNTFAELLDDASHNDPLLPVYRQVLSGSRPHEERVCSEFKLTTDQYRQWLLMLVTLLSTPPISPTPMEPRNAFDRAIKGLFESHSVAVRVYQYDVLNERDVCLLSDRGFNMPLPAETPGMFAFDFNICASAFASFVFIDPMKYVPAGLAPRFLAAAASLKANVQVSSVLNDLDALAKYNQLAVYQCASRVYAARPSPRLHSTT